MFDTQVCPAENQSLQIKSKILHSRIHKLSKSDHPFQRTTILRLIHQAHNHSPPEFFEFLVGVTNRIRQSMLILTIGRIAPRGARSSMAGFEKLDRQPPRNDSLLVLWGSFCNRIGGTILLPPLLPCRKQLNPHPPSLESTIFLNEFKRESRHSEN